MQEAVDAWHGGTSVHTAIGHIQLAAADQGNDCSRAHQRSVVGLPKLLISAVKCVGQRTLKLLRAEGHALLGLARLSLLHGRGQEGIALAPFAVVIPRLQGVQGVSAGRHTCTLTVSPRCLPCHESTSERGRWTHVRSWQDFQACSPKKDRQQIICTMKRVTSQKPGCDPAQSRPGKHTQKSPE